MSAGQRLRVRLDGSPLPNAWTETRFAPDGVNRGAHQFQALVTHARGHQLAANQEITFYMWQASRLLPNR